MKNISLLLLAILISFAGGELALRITLDEYNYMSPILEEHPVLGHAIAPGTGGHDAWGFRNKVVPETATVVAIGDSQTYGYSATAAQSWPAQLESLSGWTVYNLAMGGYGVWHYQYLFKHRALSLKPRTVLIGFYLGNDILDTYQGSVGYNQLESQGWQEGDGRFLEPLRVWLSQHVLTYQVLKHELENLVNIVRFAEMVSLEKPDHYPLDHPLLRTIFTPEHRLATMDQSDSQNREGLRMALSALEEIGVTCRERSIECRVLLIPTKESVYWPIGKDLLSGKARKNVARLVRIEEEIKNNIINYLEKIDISYLELLEALREASETESLYLTNEDGHPNSGGYAAIARAVYEWLRTSSELSEKETGS